MGGASLQSEAFAIWMSIDTKLYLLFDDAYKLHSNQKQNYRQMIPFKLFIIRVLAEVVTNLGCFSTHFLQERFLCLKFGDLLFPGWVSGVIPFSSAAPNQNEAQCPFSRDETPKKLGYGAHFLGMTQKRNWKMVPFFQG